MPGLNFDYTKFLREQNEKYIKKYGKDPIKAGENPQPIIGYSGHVPSYRNSIHELRVVRSLVRCINSPMKPTTATGYRSKSRQFFSPEDEPQTPLPPPEEGRKESTEGHNKQENSPQPNTRAVSAPARTQGTPTLMGVKIDPHLGASSPHPSHISMMSAGSSALLSKEEKYRPKTSLPKSPCEIKRTSRNSTAPSSRSSARSSVQFLPSRVPVFSKRPTGYPQTLYGSSYWFDWRGETPRPKESREQKRPDSFDRDRKLTRADGVLYHRHEGMVPKYLGYVPGYKFRHGSTFGVLTVNATAHGVANQPPNKQITNTRLAGKIF